ncbi:MAG TPA: GNAT family N-acetyltransferase [Steroidobacteraceae bacterium]|jgi:ribosomal protein S18 acetylase RimI-like enzyme|nr:GNAT family N-acetyltransferase [Steroidobacteraceae bacterium]
MNGNVDRHESAPVGIRRATVADAAALAEFGARTFYETFAADNTTEDMRLHLAEAWRPELQRAEILDPQVDTLLACDARGTLAGFAQLHAGHAPAGIATVQPVELLRFYVDKPWQGRGLAHQLMREVETQARLRGARELWLGVWERNERAQAFYRKHGFRQVGKKTFVVGTDPQTDHVMLREL